MEAIVAIEEMTSGIGYKNGDLLLKNKLDMQRFIKVTSGKKMICGRKTYETLPSGVGNTRGRSIHIVTRRNIAETEELIKGSKTNEIILIGGGKTYETFEKYVNTWYITWFYQKMKLSEEKDLVRFSPNLEDFSLMYEVFPFPFMRFNTYKRKWNERKYLV